jgi:hypothetical protein
LATDANLRQPELEPAPSVTPPSESAPAAKPELTDDLAHDEEVIEPVRKRKTAPPRKRDADEFKANPYD